MTEDEIRALPIVTEGTLLRAGTKLIRVSHGKTRMLIGDIVEILEDTTAVWEEAVEMRNHRTGATGFWYPEYFAVYTEPAEEHEPL